MMRITEAGLRKIVREMLKEASEGVEDEFDTNMAEYEAQLAAKAKGVQADNAKNIVSNLRNQLTLGATPTAAQPLAPAPTPAPARPATPAPVAAPVTPSVKNSKVMQFQNFIGAPSTGVWDQQTQAKFMNFVTSKINGGVKVTGSNGILIDANALSNWKNVAGQIRLVGINPTLKGFAPNIDGLISFISMLNSNELANQAINSLNQPEEEKPWDEVKDMTADYFDWGAKRGPINTYFTPPGVNNMSNTATNLVQPVSNPAPGGRRVFKRQPRKK